VKHGWKFTEITVNFLPYGLYAVLSPLFWENGPIYRKSSKKSQNFNLTFKMGQKSSKITAMTVNIAQLSKILHDTRKRAGLSQLELSELAGVGKTLIFDLEKGRDTVTFSNLLKVCRVLNIKIEFIPPVPMDGE
jgi:y4mF family transcriptional regulator